MTEQTAARRIAIRSEITALLTEYLAVTYGDESGDEYGDIVTEWVVVLGSTRIDWADGRQWVTAIHPAVPFTARLGLLTSAQADMLKH